MNIVLLGLIGFMTWKNRGYLSFVQIFLLLIIAFHFVPLTYIDINYADLPTLFTPAEVENGLARVVTTCLCMYLGSLVSTFVLQQGHVRQTPRVPRGLRGWIWVNMLMGGLIIVNNSLAAFQAISGGYLDMYAGGAPASSVKTITILPVYVYSLFYLFLGWISFRERFSRRAQYGLLAVFVLLVISFLFTGSRSSVIYLGVSVMVLCSARLGLKVWRYVPHAIGIIAVSTVIGVLREGSFFEMDLATMMLRPVIELTNTAVVFLTTDSIAGDFSMSGLRYVAGLLYLLPVSLMAQFGIVPPELLSQQYVAIVDPGWAEIGGGFGFSLLAELYLLGGQWAWVMSLVIGAYLGWVDFNLKSGNIAKAALAASLGFLMLFIVRGEMIELYRNVFVVVVLYLMCVVRITSTR